MTIEQTIEAAARVADRDKCLFALNEETLPDGEMCVPFYNIQYRTGMDRKTVRRHIRDLAREGLAEYHRGLWNDDGGPCGAGYCITQQGRAMLSSLEEKP